MKPQQRFTDADIRRLMADPPPSPWATWCAERRHPGLTYNTLHDLTWCACGAVTTCGDTVEWATVTAFDKATAVIRAAWPATAAEVRARAKR